MKQVDASVGRFRSSWRATPASQKVAVLGSLGVSLATAILLGIQSCDTHYLAKQAAIQSTAALEQTKLAKEAFDLVYRPSIEVNPIEFVQAISPGDELDFSLRNFGSTSANGLAASVTFLLGGINSGPKPVGGSGTISVPAGGSANFSIPFSGDEGGEVLNGVAFKVEIRFRYYGRDKDDFTDSCRRFAFDPASRKFSPSGECQ
jgi:hypothetical protein